MQERRVIDLAVDRSSPPRVLSPERHEDVPRAPWRSFLESSRTSRDICML